MKETSKTVIKYLQSLDADARITVADIAKETGLTDKQVQAICNFSVKKKGLGDYVKATVELADGNAKEVSLWSLNADGRAFDCDAEPTEA